MLTLTTSKTRRANGLLAFLCAFVTLAGAFTVGTTAGARAASIHASKHSKYYKAAVAAARKNAGAKVTISGLKVARGFAKALVKSSRSPQNYTAIFKVRSVRSMKVIAAGSSIDPIFLVELHMPFATQVKLTWHGSEKSLRSYVLESGSEDGSSTLGFTGFEGSFGRDGWQLDAGTFDSLHRSVAKAVRKRNAHAKSSKKTIDVDAAYKFNRHSKVTFDKKTGGTDFTLTLVFISRTGTFTKHALKGIGHPGRAGGVPAYTTYVLDGHHIPR